ncbi:MAG: ABC transporter ATP-binding protein, partial [Cutibacterium avidum]|nr:ABC transporter ATP-binding protein [Cutibacterium avidum]
MSPRSPHRARQVAAVHLLEVAGTALVLVAVGQAVGGRLEGFVLGSGRY